MAVGSQQFVFGKAGLTLHWDRFSWKGPAVLPAWSGFQCREGAYGGMSSDKPSEGRVTLVVSPPNNNGLAIPTPAQQAAWDFQLDHMEGIKDLILQRILREIQNIRRYLHDAEDELPDISAPEDLKKHIGLHTVSVKNFRLDKQDAPPYVGYHFGCTWDDEHGLGVVMDARVIHDFGGEDVCC